MGKIKNSHIFSLSFLVYPILICYEELFYYANKLFYDLKMPAIFFAFFRYISYLVLIIAISYQLFFIVKLRKKENIGFGRSIFMGIVRFFQILVISSVVYLTKIFFFGYHINTWILPTYVRTAYGFDALRNNMFAIIVAPPILVIAFVLTIIWKGSKKKRHL